MPSLAILFILSIIFVETLEQTCDTECPLGLYFDSCKDFCVQCPSGSYCVGNSTGYTECDSMKYNPYPGSHSSYDCLQCEPGFYTDTGTGYQSCDVCTEGSFCSGFAKTACSSGEYTDTFGATSCQTCPDGHECPDKMTTPVPCAVGEYLNVGGNCATCGDGLYTSSEGTDSCTTCEAGFFCDGGIREKCPRGTFSPAGQKSCTNCDEGEYNLHPGSTSCTPCPAGYYCNSGASVPIPCGHGRFSAGGTSSCTNCTAGFYTPGITETSCTQCNAGMYCEFPDLVQKVCALGEYSINGDSVCRDCTAGYYCVDPSLPTECPLGTYADSTAPRTKCTKCPYGSYTPSTGTTTCSTCSATSECPDPRQGESPCRAGTGSTDTSGLLCVECEEGYYGTDGSCNQCPAGEMCPQTSDDPVVCPSGHYAAAGSSICTPCTAGQYADTDQCRACNSGEECGDPTVGNVACASGFYSDSNGAEYCTQCPAGSECPDPTASPNPCTGNGFSSPGSDSCLPCPNGMDCTNPAEPIPCADGKYGLETFRGGCQDCPAGQSCRRGLVFDCPSGYYSTTGLNECKICPPGSRCQTDSSPNVCGNGKYSLRGSIVCSDCPTGYYCPSKDHAPIVCPKGSYTTAIDQTSCQSCPAGNECPERDVVESLCANGHFSFAGMDKCISCPPGFECSSKSGFSPSLCASGTYSPGGLDSCASCDPGYFCPHPWERRRKCPQGTYSLPDMTECTQCPAGRRCDGNMFYECTNGWSPPGSHVCFECHEGYVCGDNRISPNPVADVCTLGGYCEKGSSARVDCPEGTYAVVDISSSLELTCEICPAGKICDGATINPVNCSSGYYCVAGSTTLDELPCPAGTIRNIPNGRSLFECEVCSEGKYCPEATLSEVNCPMGSYCPEGTAHGSQFLCPEGTYNTNEQASYFANCTQCPIGSYCLRGKDTTFECEPGYYNPFEGRSHELGCVPCEPGYACENSGMGDSTTIPCAQGHYCPRGTKSKTENPCPPGTFTDATNLHREQDCQVCPAGSYCLEGIKSSEILGCGVGYFCPGAMSGEEILLGEYSGRFTEYATQYPCPPGSFTGDTGLEHEDNCTVCTSGKYCSGDGTASEDGNCPTGYYCPPGTTFPTEYPCPAGTFTSVTNTLSIEDCSNCTSGNYCPEGSSAEVPCPAGSFTENKSTKYVGPSTDVDSESCLVCTGGYYCAEGQGTPDPCSAGSYSPLGQSECFTCLKGYYCPLGTSEENMLNNNRCGGGYFCDVGDEDGTTKCSKGYYCPEATPEEIPCPRGTFNSNLGINATEHCTPCTEGYYCIEGRDSETGECDPGYFCATGSETPSQEPCPKRTYRNDTGARFAGDCYTCLEGYYCPIKTINPILCPIGYYCPIGSFEPIPCPKGTYGEEVGLKNLDYCTDCPEGYYCDGVGMNVTSGLCDAGYFCSGKAWTSKPTDEITGGLCPKGGYCDVGSSFPVACNPGTYNNFTGGKSIDACYMCPAGYYCAGSNNLVPTGKCFGGFYCDEGSSTPVEHLTPKGFYSVEGSSGPIPCPIGTFGNDTQLSECLTCEIGFYCPELNSSLGVECPGGFYCPEGSAYPIECPPGTFSNKTGRYTDTGVGGCESCTPGYYCEREKDVVSTEVTGPCSPGYYCIGGSIEPNPIGKSYGDICPSGYYCPNGTSIPELCPRGSYNPTFAQKSLDDCTLCLPGYYCPYEAMINSTDYVCTEGYYCELGAANGTDTICPVGHYCVEGSVIPIPCNGSKYANTTGNVFCESCPSGFYCPAETVNPLPCPEGRYCPFESREPVLCPKGTYLDIGGGKNVDDCSHCSGGMYCGFEGLPEPQGECLAGYYCSMGAFDEIGNTILFYDGGLCPVGHFCPQGTGEPNKCPNGTYINYEGAFMQDHCLPCTPGSYCNDTGLDLPVGDCAPGYYCPSGSVTIFEVECPIGSFCPQGVHSPIPCSEGSYTDIPAQEICFECPIEYYCLFNCSSPLPCKEGYYCPEGTGKLTDFEACPFGTFNNRTGIGLESECLSCSGGMVCSVVGLPYPDGICSPGYYCDDSAIDNVGRRFPGDPPKICPEGYYCPISTDKPVPCPEGTFSSAEQNVEVTDCLQCPPGEYCMGVANSYVSGNCSEGYYCLSGAKTDMPSDGITGDICPVGYYCPYGSVDPIPCQEGSFASTSGKGVCDPCTEGFFCEIGEVVPSPCPEGFYCPEGLNGVKCPVGSFNNKTGLSSFSECKLCPGGKVCQSEGLWSFELLVDCEMGFYCPSGTVDPFGNIGLAGGVAGGECPEGFYCPSGTKNPVPCPDGTWNPMTNLHSEDQCQDCPAGLFCQNTVIAGNCSDGYYCPNGMFSATPAVTICPIGHHCPVGSKVPQGCENGSYQDQVGQSNCKICPKGNLCQDHAVSTPLCPLNYYCEESTPFPEYCPPGTFGEIEGLGTFEDCSNCTEGKYCQLGRIVGNCHAGHICYFGNDNPTPEDELPKGDLCPEGYYCTEGSMFPLPCTNGTVGTVRGGISEHVCGPCPAGYHCFDTGKTTNATACPLGKFCPSDSEPILCKPGTYNPFYYGKNESACLPCPEGYFCFEYGKFEVTEDNICSRGQFCPSGSETEIPCPSGTYNNETGGESVLDCLVCPGGNFCDEESLILYKECEAGTYCPEGSTSPKICPGGFYCPPLVVEPQICPGGYYCPVGTTESDEAIFCDEGYYFCPEGSSRPNPCQLGWIVKSNASDLRIKESDVCKICPGGHYGTIDRKNCLNCSIGYVCLEGATSPTPMNVELERGYICPKGHFCVEGSSDPTPCKKGEFQKDEGLGSCLPCPEYHYSDEEGSWYCKLCGANSIHTTNHETCECIGYQRAYQKSDGHCLCIPGWVHIEENIEQKNKDSNRDCQNIIYDLCPTGKIRNVLNGNCESSSVCEEFCSVGNQTIYGYLNDDGLCECKGKVFMDENQVCDSQCRASRLRIRYDRVSNSVSLWDPKTKRVEDGSEGLTPSSLFDYFECDENCDVELMGFSGDGILGIYETSTDKMQYLFGSTRRRRRQAQNLKGIYQPLVCLNNGKGVLFEIQCEEKMGERHYPIYLKDSLLNTNPSFDYGSFRLLENYCKSNLTVRSFMHIFNDPGVYVFQDNANAAKVMVVNVMDENNRCPSNAPFVPITKSNLVKIGVSRQDEISLTPDWWLVFVLFVSFFSFFLLLIAGLKYFYSGRWSKGKHDKPVFRKFVDPEEIRDHGFDSKKIRELMEEKMKNDGEDNRDLVDLENFNVDEFNRNLEDHISKMYTNFGVYKEGFLRIYHDLMEDTKAIKGLIRKKFGLLNFIDIEEYTKMIDRYRELILNDILVVKNELIDNLINEFQDRIEQVQNLKADVSIFASEKDELLIVQLENCKSIAISQYEKLIQNVRECHEKLLDADRNDDVGSIEKWNKTITRMVKNKEVESSLKKINMFKGKLSNEGLWKSCEISPAMAVTLKNLLGTALGKMKRKYEVVE